MLSAELDLIMRRKNITFIFLTVLITVIVCLQLFNHIVMLKGNESDCLCSCKVEPGVTPVNEESVVDQVDQVPHYPAENEKMFDDSLTQMLDLLGNMNEVQQNTFGDRLYEQLIELLSSIKDNRGSSSNARKLNEEIIYTEHIAEPAEIQEICPEKFMGDSLTYGYPFFRKGFATVNCSQHIPIHELVTLIFDDLHTSSLDPPAYQRVLKGLSKYHPQMKVTYLTTHTRENIEDMNANVKVVQVKKELKQGEAWSMAITEVTTKYVLIAPHLVEFDDDINLKRLVRILSHNPDVAVVSGAYRKGNGHWDIGCQQNRFINYTLTLQGGYYMSFWECLICDITPGPWLARTEDLKALEFDKR